MEVENKIVLIDLSNQSITTTLCFLSYLKKFIIKNEIKLVYVLTDHNFIYENQQKITFVNNFNYNYDYKIVLPIKIDNVFSETKKLLNLPENTKPFYPPVKDYKLHIDDGKILICTENTIWQDVSGWQNMCDNLKSRNFAVANLTKNNLNLSNIFDLKNEDFIIKIKHLANCRLLITSNNEFAWIARSYGRPVILLGELIEHFDFLYPKDLETNAIIQTINEILFRSDIRNDLSFYKIEFEEICSNLTKLLPKEYPIMNKNSKNKSLLIESRILKQNEFIIKNTIQKLGNGWGHIIYCHKNNFNHIKSICDDISPDIEIRLLEFELTRNTYNNLCLDINFWNEIDCDKILLYQTDTFIFKKFDVSFLKYDWIGSVWAEGQTENIYKNLNWKGLWGCNGGLNIRTISVIKNILRNKEIPKSIYGDCDKVTEDTYYSWYIKKRHKFPTKEIANKFSNELNFEGVFGCHQPWVGNFNKFKEMVDLIYN